MTRSSSAQSVCGPICRVCRADPTFDGFREDPASTTLASTPNDGKGSKPAVESSRLAGMGAGAAYRCYSDGGRILALTANTATSNIQLVDPDLSAQDRRRAQQGARLGPIEAYSNSAVMPDRTPLTVSGAGRRRDGRVGGALDAGAAERKEARCHRCDQREQAGAQEDVQWCDAMRQEGSRRAPARRCRPTGRCRPSNPGRSCACGPGRACRGRRWNRSGCR
jgi:hypothetical protein